MRFILALLIVTLLITYLTIPVIKPFRRIGRVEAKRIEEAFTDEEDEL